MIKIDKKKHTTEMMQQKVSWKLGYLRMSNKNIDELLVEIHRRDKLDIEFDIEYDSKYPMVTEKGG